MFTNTQTLIWQVKILLRELPHDLKLNFTVCIRVVFPEIFHAWLICYLFHVFIIKDNTDWYSGLAYFIGAFCSTLDILNGSDIWYKYSSGKDNFHSLSGYLQTAVFDSFHWYNSADVAVTTINVTLTCSFSSPDSTCSLEGKRTQIVPLLACKLDITAHLLSLGVS